VTSGIGIVVDDGSIRGIALPAASRPGRFAPLCHTFDPVRKPRRRYFTTSIRPAVSKWTAKSVPRSDPKTSVENRLPALDGLWRLGFRLSHARGARARFSEDSDRPFG
jgi:hypothetical protein